MLWQEYSKVFNWSNVKGNVIHPVSVINRSTRGQLEALKADFTSAYILIYKDIHKYRFNLDHLHDVFLYILENIQKIELKESALHYLKRACILRWKADNRQAMYFDLLKDKVCKQIESKEYGITDEFINEMLCTIKGSLSVLQWTIFKMYHVKGYTMKVIAKKLKTYRIDILRILRRIEKEISEMKFRHLFDNRYTTYENKSKHNHISSHERKALSKELDKEYRKQVDSSLKFVNLQDYVPMTIQKETIPLNKTMQYPTKRYYKVKRNNVIAYSDKTHSEYYITNAVYSHSDVLPSENKTKRMSNYRIKKYYKRYEATHSPNEVRVLKSKLL